MDGGSLLDMLRQVPALCTLGTRPAYARPHPIRLWDVRCVWRSSLLLWSFTHCPVLTSRYAPTPGRPQGRALRPTERRQAGISYPYALLCAPTPYYLPLPPTIYSYPLLVASTSYAMP
eukprot:1226099-Rhodomonas_salina.1